MILCCNHYMDGIWIDIMIKIFVKLVYNKWYWYGMKDMTMRVEIKVVICKLTIREIVYQRYLLVRQSHYYDQNNSCLF